MLRASLATVACAAIMALGPGSKAALVVVLVAVGLVLTLVVYHPYVRCAREQKRLESVTKSPLISTFAEQCASAALIRAFGAQPRCAAEMGARVDAANRSIFY